jgi:hypothetical protein
VRAALRVLPITVNETANRISITAFRSIALSRAAIIHDAADLIGATPSTFELAILQAVDGVRFRENSASYRFRALAAVTAAARTIAPSEALSISAYDSLAMAAASIPPAMRGDFLSSFRHDVEVLRRGTSTLELMLSPLWYREPNWATIEWQKARGQLQSHDWRFWIDWYEHILRPEPSQSVELIFEIQLTDTRVTVWRRSVTQVAAHLNYLADNTLSSASSAPQPLADLLVPQCSTL